MRKLKFVAKKINSHINKIILIKTKGNIRIPTKTSYHPIVW